MATRVDPHMSVNMTSMAVATATTTAITSSTAVATTTATTSTTATSAPITSTPPPPMCTLHPASTSPLPLPVDTNEPTTRERVSQLLVICSHPLSEVNGGILLACAERASALHPDAVIAVVDNMSPRQDELNYLRSEPPPIKNVVVLVNQGPSSYEHGCSVRALESYDPDSFALLQDSMVLTRTLPFDDMRCGFRALSLFQPMVRPPFPVSLSREDTLICKSRACATVGRIRTVRLCHSYTDCARTSTGIPLANGKTRLQHVCIAG